jgi:hypothetical protein
VPKFSGSSIGGKVEYDFSEWGGPAGVVEEPSRIAVKRFMQGAQQVFKDLGLRDDKEDEDGEDSISPNDLVETMNEIDDEEVFDKLTEGLLGEIAMLCGAKRIERETPSEVGGEMPTTEVTYEGGSPSYAVLTALPYRPFMGFFGYLMENIMNPELSRPVTTQSPRKLRSV